MRFSLSFLALALQNTVLVASLPPASPLGPGYLPPTDLTSSDSIIAAAWSDFSALIDSYTSTNQSIEGVVPDFSTYTLSTGAFSIYDAGAAQALQHHYTAPDVKSSNLGVTQVDGDSIYRVESVTKSFTVYLTLIEIGSRYWDFPITDFVPELAEFAEKTTPDILNVVNWKEVTLGALAGQIAGIPRDEAIQDQDLLGTLPDPTEEGLPPLNVSAEAIDACLPYVNATGIDCPEDLFLQQVTKRAPVYLPWTTPIYTNLGYNLLALVVENITGKSFDTMIKEDMLKPLGMNSTYWSGDLPGLSQAVVPGGNSSALEDDFLVTNVNDAASGGVYSTINDLAKYGTSILNSTLLSPEETRKWLKPITHTGSLQASVGRPWEILRVIQPVTGRVNDLYTKEGDGTGSSAYLILSPDHGAGISILIAGNGSTVLANTVVADAIVSTLIPAFEAQAAKESSLNFAGTYKSPSPSLNSSVTLSVDPTQGPGLMLKSWVTNGTDLSPFLLQFFGDEGALFPTDLSTAGPGKAGKTAFRATFGNSTNTRSQGLFTQENTIDGDWVGVDANIYGGVAIDLFVFDIDAKGQGVSVTPAAFRALLKKVA